MSIINKMHQDFQQVQQEQPIIAQLPEKKGKKKALLLTFIALLMGSSLGLSYLIFIQNGQPIKNKLVTLERKHIDIERNKQSHQTDGRQKSNLNVVPAKSVATQAPSVNVQQDSLIRQQPVMVDLVSEKKTNIKAEIAQKEKVTPPSVTTINQHADIQPVAEKLPVASIPAEKIIPVVPAAKQKSALQIKEVKLDKTQLAQINLKQAKKAEEQGNLKLAAEKRKQALALVPTLYGVRKSLALYYYGTGSVNKAKQLLQEGAVMSPEYSDFNLMLSRIALKEGDQQKAYLYLEQHPPAVQGHLDYYASHAILAQKFHKYEQSEGLYRRLLSQRPNNGRWRMSLAIAQDKQAKPLLAISNYKQALLQTDLSEKAKDYISQRLVYLESRL